VTMTTEQSLAYAQGIVRDFGSWVAIDHALYNTTDLERRVVGLALDLGWSPVDPDGLDALMMEGSPVWDEDPDKSAEMLGWFHDEAIDYLNEHACPDGYVWEHDGHAGAFGCWRITEGYIA